MEADSKSRGGVRLQKFIADCGLASRRRAEAMIAAGRVRVNGETVSRQGVRIDPERDRVEVDGSRLRVASKPKTTILLHKPLGYLCSMDDPRKRPLVKDLYRELPGRLFPVGRLDYNTSGLLLCTDDGELANLLMHPRYKFEKEYLVTVNGRFGPAELAALCRGVELADGPARPLSASMVSSSARRSRLKLVIGEGRNRQVRRMLEALGFKVVELQRTRYAFLTLKGVPRGKWRKLESGEIDRLRRMALHD